ncbi:MAG TPA: VWA domain-containing protein [Streptosporangiaceae bacterium]|nr:VWA domain-containing protein [Streptosporangiaceae bacterium]
MDLNDGPHRHGNGLAGDIAAVTAEFGAALHEAGVPADPGRCERFARAVTLMRPRSTRELHACGLATLVSSPEEIEIYDRLFAAAFGDRLSEVVAARPAEPASEPGPSSDGMPPLTAPGVPQFAQAPADGRPEQPDGDEPGSTVPWRTVSSAAERLASRDFSDLSADELSQLEALMRQLVLATPPRRTRRYRPMDEGSRLDLRATLRQARRTVGEPVYLARRAPRLRTRRLIVLCDISGSMEPYARAMLQFLYCASRGVALGPSRGGARRRPGGAGVGREGRAGAARTEVFTFATRLTRITSELVASRPETVLARAGKAAPDWSGGTRIGASIKEFNDVYGRRGLARGAVVLIISDGWETGDPAQLGAEMARLSRVAYKIVWANPRTKSPRYRPEVGGMAAAWPYCDAVVSAHSLNALDDLIAALAGPS